MSTSPDAITSGRIICVAQAEALVGKESEVARHLTIIRKAAESDAEPGTHTYRVVQYGTKFKVFEEYEDLAAFKAHFNGAPFQAFAAVTSELLVGGEITGTFYSELK
ncbi:hypothetical protein SISNIDRAFT_298633 [Sistotremastrum niveocremeum HHB9708]|uniref:ABM domain-containing protein n=2 Tax=Sistotremastraceae TaxID=3402574 RepID=A0A164NI95_9AGAM|nr:hypothetical protein SISNIDRAFT_298633 [Sistotremastrum niveocremeum HHB9708]KZT35364.1 hypothetical protein SISSUDRAFT_174236 [Sistotremastrum suecicum HHB10207 ss-3]